MKKYISLPILLLPFLFSCAYGQKTKNYVYVDSVNIYNNGDIIYYKDKGKPKIDTVYFKKHNVNIETVEVVNYYEGNLPKKQKL